MTDRPDPTWYLQADDGRIAWTPAGLAELGPHFARAGIDIHTVRTRDQLRQAWRAADPYLRETLLAIARNGPMTLERRALVAVARNDEAEFQRLVAVLIRRNQLGLRLVE
ncbi:MAG: hypothetical protein U1F76_14225 [Candidatus Competibacteraceae bacterium]